MDTYEIVLMCSCCGAVAPLGSVEANSPFEAKDKAIQRWPDARESEMVVRSVKQQEICSAFPVEQLAS